MGAFAALVFLCSYCFVPFDCKAVVYFFNVNVCIRIVGSQRRFGKSVCSCFTTRKLTARDCKDHRYRSDTVDQPTNNYEEKL